MSSLIVLFLLFLLSHAYSDINQGEFSFNGYLNVDGSAELDSSGLFKLTNSSRRQSGHIFYKNPIQFKNSTEGSVFSFSTTFIFAIVPESPPIGGHGLAFVISPNKELSRASPSQYLGLFNFTNNGNSTNHIVAVELDTVRSLDVEDIDDNHVGIDINSVVSAVSASAGYFTDDGVFKSLTLRSGDSMQIWVEYDGAEKQMNVTLHPINITKPKTPLLSLKRDLSPYILDSMYVGFSSSTGSLQSSHYILAWNFKMNGRAEDLDLSQLPKLPRRVIGNQSIKPLKKILVISLSLTGVTLVVILIFGAVLISKKKRLTKILEDWEVQYGPHRFSYKHIFKATKGFREKEVLGKGGFGRVYKGVLPSSNTEAAVKRISHDSRQGMREFVAEIATIGRLGHPNLVRLLGYCRRKHELLLVYDYMPNGSLDKFLYHLPNTTLNWSQRFKIIKDVASALFYLHRPWIQVIIHRDIKPANVLIDSEMNARLGDFGLAKLCDIGNDPQTSHVAGTLGYIAPELARTGKANTSTDIYAFGVFILEVACGRRPIDPRAPPDEILLADWITDCRDAGDILKSVDRRLEKRYVVQEAELVLKLGLLCSHPVAVARPSMSSVVSYLDGVAHFPDNLRSVIKAREFPGGSNEAGAANELITETNSVACLTITEPFVSRGR
ncbi:hypothetical protein PTKIN_Ptkin12aG0045300 [Pterospermum kingtungense]